MPEHRVLVPLSGYSWKISFITFIFIIIIHFVVCFVCISKLRMNNIVIVRGDGIAKGRVGYGAHHATTLSRSFKMVVVCSRLVNIKYTWSWRRTRWLNRRHPLHRSLVRQSPRSQQAHGEVLPSSKCLNRNRFVRLYLSRHRGHHDQWIVDTNLCVCIASWIAHEVHIVASTVITHPRLPFARSWHFYSCFGIAYARSTLMLSDNKPFRCHRVYTFRMHWIWIHLQKGRIKQSHCNTLHIWRSSIDNRAKYINKSIPTHGLIATCSTEHRLSGERGKPHRLPNVYCCCFIVSMQYRWHRGRSTPPSHPSPCPAREEVLQMHIGAESQPFAPPMRIHYYSSGRQFRGYSMPQSGCALQFDAIDVVNSERRQSIILLLSYGSTL